MAVVVLVLILAAPAVAQSSISMPAVRYMARKQAARMILVYDASDYRVNCNQTGRITAYCRLRMLAATDSDGGNYDCSVFIKYKLHADGAIYSKMAGDDC